MAAALTIRLFGEPELQIDGAALALNNQKARALLFYLAATEQPHARNHLAALLWSEAPSDNARRSLRAALFQLRRALHAAGLEHMLAGEAESLRLEPAAYECDVAEFRRLVAAGSEPELAQAIAMYRGALLAGFSLPNAPLFDEWARFGGTRHDSFLRPEHIARTIAHIVFMPRGSSISYVELQPEAPGPDDLGGST